ncbi:MAG: VanZ family protein, partial [Clostridia bacterium]|nr:VanZ family protein [Clostridia bacterium]
WMGKRRGNFGFAWAGGTFYAALDELHQLLVDGRSGQVRDVGIDSAGVLTGVLAAAGMIRLMANRKRNHSREPV